MEKLTQAEQAFLDAQESQYGLFDNKHKTLEIVKAAIFWKNFQGRENQFGNATRTFKVAVVPEVAQKLEERGWNVRSYRLERKNIEGQPFPPVIAMDNGEPATVYFIEIKVNFNSEWPPHVERISQIKGETVREIMDIYTVSNLDSDTFLDASIEVNERVNERTGKATGYLRKLIVVTDPAEKDADFGGRYVDYQFN